MEPSKLQKQCPLSPKKFWKKILEKIVIFIILSLAIGFAIVMLMNSDTEINTGLISSTFLYSLIPLLIILGIYGTYVYWYIRTYYYEAGEDFLTIRKGVFTPAEIHVQYLKIQDVYVDQDILDRILGIYDVHISSATYTSGISAHIDGVSKQSATIIKDLLLSKIKGSSNSSNNKMTNEASNSTNQTTGNVKEVTLSKPISSSVYGLSSDWWGSEIVKLVVGATAAAAAFALFVYLNITEDQQTSTTPDQWKWTFYLWLAALVIGLLFRAGYLWLWKLHYSYNFDKEYIYMKTGILSVSEKHMAYNTIQDVRIHQTLVDRIFGVADLIIENASPQMVVLSNNREEILSHGIVIEGLSIADAKNIASEIKDIIIHKPQSVKFI